MRAIALTGRIGSGKSSVARYLRAGGAATIDADAIVHALYREDDRLRAMLADRFGPAVLAPDGVNRVELGRIVFSDPQARRDLEAVVYPRVHEREAAFLAHAQSVGSRIAVIEAVKVVESGGTVRCDELWIVTCPEAVAIARLADRGMDAEEASRRLASQGDVPGWVSAFQSESARLGRRRAVVIIDNGGTFADACAQVGALVAHIRDVDA